MRFLGATAVLITLLAVDFAANAMQTRDAHGWDTLATVALVAWTLAYLFGGD